MDTDNMLDITIDEDLALITELFDTPHCESNHSSPGNEVCTHQVAGYYHCDACDSRKAGCQAQLRWFLTVLATEPDVLHAGCFRPIKDVWRVTS